MAKAKSKIKKGWGSLLGFFDNILEDFLAVAGIALIHYGLSRYDPNAAYIVTGIVILLGGIARGKARAG